MNPRNTAPSALDIGIGKAIRRDDTESMKKITRRDGGTVAGIVEVVQDQILQVIDRPRPGGDEETDMIGATMIVAGWFLRGPGVAWSPYSEEALTSALEDRRSRPRLKCLPMRKLTPPAIHKPTALSLIPTPMELNSASM